MFKWKRKYKELLKQHEDLQKKYKREQICSIYWKVKAEGEELVLMCSEEDMKYITNKGAK